MQVRALHARRLYTLLCIVPCTATGIHGHGQQDAGDSGADKEGACGLCLQHHPNHDRSGHHEHPGCNHRAQRGADTDVHTLRIIRLGLAFHNAGNLPELAPHFIDHFVRRLPHRPDGKGREGERQQCTDERTDKHNGIGNIDGGEVRSLEICGEQQEGGERSHAHGIAFGQCLGGVAHGVQAVCPFAGGLIQVRHLHNTAGIVRDGSEDIHR